MHYLLFYEVDNDYVSKRAQFRTKHLNKAWQASERGELVLAGALANPVDGAVLLFKGDSPEVAERFAKADPYVTGGAVKRWYVREWTTVAGAEATKPVRPQPIKKAENGAEETSDPNRVSELFIPDGTILRLWKGRSSPEKAGEYILHAKKKVFPKLRAISGHRGAYLLRHASDRQVEFLVLTLWDSMEAVQEFTGQYPDEAVVEPEARSALSGFDDFVTHYDVVHTVQSTD